MKGSRVNELRLSLRSLRAAAAGCQACDLCKRATQTVFGEGRARLGVAPARLRGKRRRPRNSRRAAE